MSERKPDFSGRAYMLPHINPEGRRFGFAAIGVAALAFYLALCLAEQGELFEEE